MARRSVPPAKPKTPILTVGQKRRRIERLRMCIIKLEAFDPQKARNRAPAVLELEAAIDKALSSAFGYGTAAYLRYNEAATLDPSPLLANATVRAAVSRPGGPTRRDVKVQETRQQYSSEQGACHRPASERDPYTRRRNRRCGARSCRAAETRGGAGCRLG
jgi:hypothetical protein